MRETPAQQRPIPWSWRLGRVFGIDVFVHATFVLLLTWIAWGYYARTGELGAVVLGVGFILAVFGVVVLHELGHALTARRFGIRTRDITLLPIGGVARLERMPENPRHELLVALAGPAVNVAIAGALYVGLRATGSTVALDDPSLFGSGPFLTRLLWVNVMLAGFNLLPAFPMDGGRALRALLAMRGDYVAATLTAARLGQAIAVMLGIVGLLGNPLLVLIAVFVWIGAAAEASAVETKATLEGIPVQAAMITDFRALTELDTLATAAQMLLAGSQIDFPVLDPAGELIGVLTRTDLVRGLTEHGADAAVATLMARHVATAEPDELLSGALTRMRQSEHSLMPSLMPVVRGGRVIGIVTLENIAELMMVNGALRTSPRADRPRGRTRT